MVPVYLEPVSGTEIPAYREYNRETLQIETFRSLLAHKINGKSRCFRQLSLVWKQGIAAASSGILIGGTGITVRIDKCLTPKSSWQHLTDTDNRLTVVRLITCSQFVPPLFKNGSSHEPVLRTPQNEGLERRYSSPY